ncbi:hypothetical protein A3D42_03015 [Candidatus Nomurabacteria bacterium RIFCSPHIGHO2_02_FULL_41_18]|uniref:Uncharacterized protein n=1 Tax=Candidatus Nomurabacteria bacterium RIFCSPHIGHO2_02_FULL_41_18 TaxID=1801754 RepID=A0A1F6W6J0_9BACT|nr:MAG: hypothetical protein A2737_02280 [Candidatus Nomurabacteria bacterium RIFCSPHIGHO2_01_FULL_41_71]OGI77523.1 MAG: hypothetical protein A3D42_03015 [Candidatus Nomurabacteria bacterium RIFCSPHIGHO2_02_FULL_41_18]OGI89540.1 MAG: hypothetical protein A3B01_00095 [Candidatus Nomurabacteria bacterium RIFCSPLOWO2_01_FULL_41_52b]
MKTKEDIEKQIEIELKKREKSIRNKNAIEKLLGLAPGLDALYGVLVGSKEAIEIERQKLSLEKVLELVIAIDNKLNGEDISNVEPGLKILISNVVAEGDITGLDGRTSDDSVQKIFEKPVDIAIKDSRSGGSITGLKLNVDKEMEIKDKTKVETDLGTVSFNPALGKITLGEGLDGKES